jgi:hypothetical protein
MNLPDANLIPPRLALSLTPHFSGVGTTMGGRNRFNGFSANGGAWSQAGRLETVETVRAQLWPSCTPLKWGVNEKPRSGQAGGRVSSPAAGPIARRQRPFLTLAESHALRVSTPARRTSQRHEV